MTPSRRLLAIALFCIGLAAPATGQLAPFSVPKGLLRFDLGGRFDSWDQRYNNGVKQDAATDFTFNPFDGRSLATLDSANAAFKRVTGVQAINLSLGRTASSMLVNIGTGYLGAAYGISSRLSVFGTVPIVRVRVQNRFAIDTVGATAGFNPANITFGTDAGAAQTTTFLNQLKNALTQLSTQLTNGAFDADPARKALAQQIVATGTPLDAGLTDLLGAVFLPLKNSLAAGALTAPIESLRQSIVSLAEPGVSLTASPALPVNGPTTAEFQDFATNLEGPLQARSFSPQVLQYLGDIELGSAFTWLDRRARPGGFAIRSVVIGTVRLGTGRLDRPDNFFDIGTGDRQPDVQGDVVTDVSRGRFGARLSGRYVLQLPGRMDRRVSPPDQPFAPATTLASIQVDPGEIIQGSVEPFVRIAPTLLLSAGVQYWSKGADTYTYVLNQEPIAGTTPDVLGIGSKQNATSFSAGLTFSHDGLRADGTRGMPMDAWVRWEMLASSGLGRVPATQSVSLMIRFYRKGP